MDSASAPSHGIRWRSLALQLALLALVAATRLYSYLLFHTLAEFYSILIAFTFFVIAWQTRKLNEDPPIATLGLAYLFVGILDVFHTLGFAGMNVLTDYAFPANQVWILARVLEALSLLLFTFLNLGGKARLGLYLGALSLYTILGLSSIFVFRIFPACFVQGQGQTTFKVSMEIAVIAILLAAAGVLWARRRLFARDIHRNLEISIILTALSEVPFALYHTNYDLLNMAGHLLKIVSFYLVYRSVVVTGLERPQEMLFQSLQARDAELAAANRTQNAVLSILAHDLRGPLGSVANITGSLAAEWESTPDEEKRSLLLAVEASSTNTLALVEGILEWAKSLRQDLSPSLASLGLAEICGEELRLLSGIAKAKGIRILADIAPEAVVRADRTMLGAVVRNLVHNAIKFSPRDSEVEISATALQGSWLLCIKDHGRGMDAQTLAGIFHFNGRPGLEGTEGEKGAGIGLEMAKRLIDAMGATITVESRPGEGSTFSLGLPLA